MGNYFLKYLTKTFYEVLINGYINNIIQKYYSSYKEKIKKIKKRLDYYTPVGYNLDKLKNSRR